MEIENLVVIHESQPIKSNSDLMITLQLYLRLNKKLIDGEGLKILTSKQMLQRLPIAFAQVKAGNKSENLLNQIRQIIYCLY